MYLKPMIAATAVVLATSAFAAGVSQKTPGYQMKHAKTSTGPGASEYAPGHKMQKVKSSARTTSTAPGASEYTPSHSTTTTGINTKR
jgi:hypothetical protein